VCSSDLGDFDAGTFEENYFEMLSTLAGGLLQGNGFQPTIVTANIPSVTSAAFFLQEAVFVAASGGAWPWGYEEAEVQIVLFPALGWIADPENQLDPIPSTYTLTLTELDLIDSATAAYNDMIEDVTADVAALGLAKCAMVDANSALAGLTPGQKTHFLLLLGQGLDIPTAAATTYFGLDGVHPNSVGYAFTANLFIEVINSLDGTNLPSIDLDSITWDPTYGVPISAASKEGWDGAIKMSPEVTASMNSIFR